MKWQGKKVWLSKAEDGSLELIFNNLTVLYFPSDRKEVQYIENGVTLNEGFTSIVALDDARGIPDPESFPPPEGGD